MKSKDQAIDSELRLTGKFIRFFTPSFKVGTLKLAKKLTGALKGKVPTKLFYEEVYIPRLDGTFLRLTVYAPIKRKYNAPGLLYMHGGGYGLGIPEMNEKLFKLLIDETGCVIISPDYTLSVEKPYPAAIDDCYLALLWMKKNHLSYMINPNQLMIAGDSAGGGLTAALALLARDKNEVQIAFQMPLYPMIDDRMNTPSAINNDDPVWNSKQNKLAWELYLGELFGKDEVPYYAAPARAQNLKNLPPTMTYVGSVEPFLDETIDFVSRLKLQGNEVNFKIFEGGYHAFDILSDKTQIGIAAKNYLLDSFKYAIKNHFKENKDI
ncbi:alpha/beta hydrolase [Acholeplasma laidlawii]|uniref:alpha/beta hydrolase n=1 Tax=Acholeplasma laidlawii TaxID=2148 RepID=UPI0018C2744D|nr:alpha/beta hydrolase [Acholeplasma laidlawii]MBG0762201.1 alpha/beta hydrolase [Acholeplasma laidlawii]